MNHDLNDILSAIERLEELNRAPIDPAPSGGMCGMRTMSIQTTVSELATILVAALRDRAAKGTNPPVWAREQVETGPKDSRVPF